MNISEKNRSRIFNFFLILIAVTIVFRKPCTWILIAFSVFCLSGIKQIKLSKKALLIGAAIALPFLLEIVFFFKNDTLGAGLKAAEKTVSMLLLPLFILGNYREVKMYKVLFYFSRGIQLVMVFLFFRFIVVFPQYMQKYIHGIDLWEMGYEFTKSFGVHAPAMNMHLGFAAVLCFYFVYQDFKYKNAVASKLFSIAFLVLAVFFVLFVNTRMALFNMLAGWGIVLFYEFLKLKNAVKIIKITAIVGVLFLGALYAFIQGDPYMKEKYSTVTFAHMDKIGKLDEVKDPESEVFNGLVTRLSIWKAAWEVSVQNLPFGTGSADGKDELNQYYRDTNQKFLAKYEFPVHNQYLDALMKFGILGTLMVLLHIFTIAYLGISTKNALIVSFFVVFFTSNVIDDFLIRFDGIVFSALWFSVFGAYWLQQKTTYGKVQEAA